MKKTKEKTEDNRPDTFNWKNMGDIKEARCVLGEDMPVMVYRLMQYTMLDVIAKEQGRERANQCFRRAGSLAGSEFAKHSIDLESDFNSFVMDLQKRLESMKIGKLRMEEYNKTNGDITLTVGQDLDCSGLPDTNENVCHYDEGFLSGILEAYTGKKYIFREIDCWSNGGRICRFNGTVFNI